jgi:hypothetical protein
MFSLLHLVAGMSLLLLVFLFHVGQSLCIPFNVLKISLPVHHLPVSILVK